MNFSETTLQILYNGNWTEKRLLPNEQFLDKYKKAGYTIHPSALDILQRFGNLSFSFPTKTKGKPKALKGYIQNFHFNVDRTFSVCDKEDIDDFGKCIGTILCPVGESDNRHSIVTIAEDGRVFAYQDAFISLYGNNYVDAMEVLCKEKQPIKMLIYDGKPLNFLV
ncbi:hypothetical protein MHK_006541 [Candidatus Magnetomorum sp. HK-1]|nr:hypothetical protein MHK_006541 [Candidatus Magnetomorum sp. HK-1]